MFLCKSGCPGAQLFGLAAAAGCACLLVSYRPLAHLKRGSMLASVFIGLAVFAPASAHLGRVAHTAARGSALTSAGSIAKETTNAYRPGAARTLEGGSAPAHGRINK